MVRRTGLARRACSAATTFSDGGGGASGPGVTGRITAAASSARTDVVRMVACHGTSPRPRTRCGVAEPSVSAPTTTPVATRGRARSAWRPGARRRVDARERDADEEARRDRGGKAAGRHEQRVRRGGRDRCAGDEPARLEPVGKVEEGGGDAAGDEPGLDRDEQPSRPAGVKPQSRSSAGTTAVALNHVELASTAARATRASACRALVTAARLPGRRGRSPQLNRAARPGPRRARPASGSRRRRRRSGSRRPRRSRTSTRPAACCCRRR